MMRKERRKLTDLASLLVFALLAVCVLLVLLTGAKAYRALTDRGEDTYARRTAVQYLTTRVRQGGTVTVESFCGLDALVFREEIGGKGYLTRIYCHDGWLKELFAAESGEFSPADGQKILEAQSLRLSLEDGLLTGTITLPDSTWENLLIALEVLP